MELTQRAYEHCELCPRRCGAERSAGIAGVCGQTTKLKVARAALHFWEEPPISGEKGSGTIFFSGCPLRCVYCQNHEISHEGTGYEVSTARLAAMMCELEAQGALNINLVTALHFAPQVVEAIVLARQAGMSLPIVCNSSGYELPELVKALEHTVDIWLVDYKYARAELAASFSSARDYPEQANKALSAMAQAIRVRGGIRYAENGSMQQGLIVRHLVLPGHTDDSCEVLRRVYELAGDVCELSVMNQYTPNEQCRARSDDLSRGLTCDEYERVLDYADEFDFAQLWWQEGGTVSESFVPAFDATGVAGPELS